MEVIKHVSLFEDRHLFPSYVRDSVYPGKEKYHVKDRDLLRSTALASLTRWKEEGFTSVYVYLSGLNSAVRALEYAAWKLGMYLRIYEYSYSQDTWLPDTIEPFETRSPHPFTKREIDLWDKETELRKQFVGKEETLHLVYMDMYNNMRLLLRDNKMKWDDIQSLLNNLYYNISPDILGMMKPYLTGKYNNDPRKEGFHEKLRDTIISWRGKKQTTIPGKRQLPPNKKTTPINESPGQRLDRLVGQAARDGGRRKRKH